MSSLATESGIFDTIAGLPVHPLVVHLTVIVLPVSAVAFIALVFARRLRPAYAWLAAAGLVVGAVAALVAKESGEALAERVGTPAQHASYGTILPILGILLAIVAVAWIVVQRRSAVASRDSGVVTVLGGLGSLLAVGVLALTVLVGHSGAEAVWGSKIAATNASATSVSTPAVTSTAKPTAKATATATTSTSSASTTKAGATAYTMADVATHNSAQSCWAAVSGDVYDLTTWIGKHPGGSSVIKALCGTDATSAFLGAHRGERRPASELATFKIGTLAG